MAAAGDGLLRRLTVVRFGILLALFTALVAPVLAEDCDARMERPWAEAGPGYRIQAMTIGPSCGRAVVVLVVRDGQDVPLWIDTLTTMNLELLGLADTPQQMKEALETWIDPAGSDLTLASSLPAWPEDAAAPSDTGDIVLEIEPGLDRIDWEGMRARNLPLYCYSKDIDCSTCLVLEPVTNAVTRIGLRVYPQSDPE